MMRLARPLAGPLPGREFTRFCANLKEVLGNETNKL
jgi:hypothetical protein